jgi:uncharacterized membrane protein
MGYIILVFFYVFCPVLVIYLSGRYRIVKQAGSVVICYGLGLILGNVGLLPGSLEAVTGIQVPGAEVEAGPGSLVYQIQDSITTAVILLAIPLLLFSLDVGAWVKMAGKTFLSLVLGLASVLITIFLGYFIFSELIPDIWEISGMLTAVYSGGTPNMAAIRLALDIDANRYIVTHTYDLVVGAVVLLFYLTVAQRFFLLFMRPFKMSDRKSMEASVSSYDQQFESYEGLFSRKVFLPLLAAVGISAAISGISFLISSGVIAIAEKLGKTGSAESLLMTVMILSITSLGILASRVPSIRRIKKTFQAGMYFILVFCLVVASMADLRIFSFESWPILVYIILAVPGSLLVHSFLSKLFRVDVDNFLIISVALSMAPPFVPVVAAALKNKYIIIPGLVIGIIGYAAGNYLGILIAVILKH